MNTANESQKENNFIPRRPSSPKGFESTIPNTIQYFIYPTLHTVFLERGILLLFVHFV